MTNCLFSQDVVDADDDDHLILELNGTIAEEEAFPPTYK